MKDHAVFIVRSGPKCIFVRRSLSKKTLPGIWAFPSGTVENNESFEQTAVREAKEEFAVDVVAVGKIASRDLPEFDTRLHFVLCDLVSGQPVVKDTDEFDQIAEHTFDEFFTKYSDDQIGHGLVWLRANPKIWRSHNL